MASSKSRTDRRAKARAAGAQPRVETEAERIQRLRLARMARDLGLLPAPGTLGAPRAPDAPIRRCDVEPSALLDHDLPRLHLQNEPRPARARPPMPTEAELRAARDAWIARHGKPEPIKAAPGIPADVAALIASAGRRALGPSELAKITAALAGAKG